jgi:RNA polymerase sigma factor (sigma-70 family)
VGELDPELVRALGDLHAQSWGWALACCERRPDDAAEVLQDSYEKVLSGRARFSAKSTLKTWFFGVIRITAMERRRSVVVRLFRRGTVEPDAPTKVSGPDSSASATELREVLASALLELSPKQREVLHLVFYDDLSIAEAAEVMAVSLGTARLHYDRGKKSLADKLKKRGIELS